MSGQFGSVSSVSSLQSIESLGHSATTCFSHSVVWRRREYGTGHRWCCHWLWCQCCAAVEPLFLKQPSRSAAPRFGRSMSARYAARGRWRGISTSPRSRRWPDGRGSRKLYLFCWTSTAPARLILPKLSAPYRVWAGTSAQKSTLTACGGYDVDGSGALRRTSSPDAVRLALA